MDLEIEYLKIKANLLINISVEEFNKWKYFDCFGNVCKDVQFKEDLRRELEKVERYDLLLEL